MKYTRYFRLVAAALLLGSCNNDPEQTGQQVVINTQPALKKESESLPQEIDTTDTEPVKPYVDSFKIEMDSLLNAKIELPPVYTQEILGANAEATAKFSKLAAASNGRMKVLVNAELVAKEVEHTINKISVPQSDLLILIDKTYSMVDDIATVKDGVSQIIDTVKKYKGTRLAVALYGDKTADGMGWYVFKEFGTDYAAAQQFISQVHVEGGGMYWEESVYEAILESLDKPFWQSTKKRNIILIGDAPPFEAPHSEYTLSDVIKKSRESSVKMNFYPIIITPTVANARLTPEEKAKYQPLKLTTALYPNPTKGHIDVGFEENGTYYIEIYNVAGQAIVSEEAYGISWGKDLPDVPDGMYVLRVINKEHKFELVKFVLKR